MHHRGRDLERAAAAAAAAAALAAAAAAAAAAQVVKAAHAAVAVANLRRAQPAGRDGVAHQAVVDGGTRDEASARKGHVSEQVGAERGRVGKARVRLVHRDADQLVEAAARVSALAPLGVGGGQRPERLRSPYEHVAILGGAAEGGLIRAGADDGHSRALGARVLEQAVRCPRSPRARCARVAAQQGVGDATHLLRESVAWDCDGDQGRATARHAAALDGRAARATPNRLERVRQRHAARQRGRQRTEAIGGREVQLLHGSDGARATLLEQSVGLGEQRREVGEGLAGARRRAQNPVARRGHRGGLDRRGVAAAECLKSLAEPWRERLRPRRGRLRRGIGDERLEASRLRIVFILDGDVQRGDQCIDVRRIIVLGKCSCAERGEWCANSHEPCAE